MVKLDEFSLEACRRMEALYEFTWTKTRIFWPRKCSFTGKWLKMFSIVYKGRRHLHISLEVPGVTQVRWTTPDYYTFIKLRGKR